MTRSVAVVGAGAAGLTAALRAAEAGARVLLLNAHPKIGLKILMSGGTRCNVTHKEVTERDFNGGSPMFVRNVLRAFTPDQARAWLESLGVALKLEDTGKYFPESDNAQTVLDALVGAVERAGVEVVSGARVVRLSRRDTGAGFRLGVQGVRDSVAFDAVRPHGLTDFGLPAAEPDRWLEADAVILASGGLSFPRTGSDGVGYALAQSLGHSLEPTVPALTPLTASDPWCQRLQGVTLPVEITLWIRGQMTTLRTRGSFLFTHFGYSGPAALDFSRHWLRTEEYDGRSARASFLPDSSTERVFELWRTIGDGEPRVSARRVLTRDLPESVVVALAEDAGVDIARPLSQVPRVARVRLASQLLTRELPITGTLGYEKAEVTAGGVRLAEVSHATLESRIVPGLYLCGEVLDVEGRLGGFNFQWAWSSGTVAGLAAAKGSRS